MTPLVSVIIPAYNPSAALREAVESALGQTHPSVEVIVVDDGSTADTSWVPAAYGGRIRYVRKANGGPASARNAGLALARGTYVAFLDADDVWEPGKLAAQVEAMERHPAAGLAYGPVLRIDGQGRPQGVRRSPQARSGLIAGELFMKNFVPTSTVMVRRACFEAAGRFDEARERHVAAPRRALRGGVPR
jgi:glycosyltransferase involved in cell wall biosynthesis